MPKKVMTFAEVEELACLTYQAVMEFTGDKHLASKKAQAVWNNNPDV